MKETNLRHRVKLLDIYMIRHHLISKNQLLSNQYNIIDFEMNIVKGFELFDMK